MEIQIISVVARLGLSGQDELRSSGQLYKVMLFRIELARRLVSSLKETCELSSQTMSKVFTVLQIDSRLLRARGASSVGECETPHV